MNSTENALVFACGGKQLVGIVHCPARGAGDIGIVLVVGGPQYRVGSHRQFVLMARSFAAAGYPVLRFDYRGMGDSDGDAANFEQVDDDIAVAIDTLLRTAPDLKRIVLWGLCDAASACMIYGSRKDHRVQACVLANPWVRTTVGEASAYLRHYYVRRLLQRSFWTKVLGGAFDLRRSLRELLDTAKRAKANPNGSYQMNFIDRMLEGVLSAPRPTLLLISANDLTAKEFEDHCEKNSAWSRWRRAPTTTVRNLAGMDHTFSGEGAVQQVATACIQWIENL